MSVENTTTPVNAFEARAARLKELRELQTKDVTVTTKTHLIKDTARSLKELGGAGLKFAGTLANATAKTTTEVAETGDEIAQHIPGAIRLTRNAVKSAYTNVKASIKGITPEQERKLTAMRRELEGKYADQMDQEQFDEMFQGMAKAFLDI